MIPLELLFELNIKEIKLTGNVGEKKNYLTSIYPLICNRLLRYCRLEDQNHIEINIYNIKQYFNDDDLLEELKCLIFDYSNIDYTVDLIELYDPEFTNITINENNVNQIILDYLNLDNQVLLGLCADTDNLRDEYLKNISYWFKNASNDFLSI